MSAPVRLPAVRAPRPARRQALPYLVEPSRSAPRPPGPRRLALRRPQ